jgi:hypothetical protein
VHGLHRLAKFDEGGVLNEFMGLSDASDEGGVDGRMMVQCGTAGQETTRRWMRCETCVSCAGAMEENSAKSELTRHVSHINFSSISSSSPHPNSFLPSELVHSHSLRNIVASNH